MAKTRKRVRARPWINLNIRRGGKMLQPHTHIWIWYIKKKSCLFAVQRRENGTRAWRSRRRWRQKPRQMYIKQHGLNDRYTPYQNDERADAVAAAAGHHSHTFTCMACSVHTPLCRCDAQDQIVSARETKAFDRQPHSHSTRLRTLARSFDNRRRRQCEREKKREREKNCVGKNINIQL